MVRGQGQNKRKHKQKSNKSTAYPFPMIKKYKGYFFKKLLHNVDVPMTHYILPRKKMGYPRKITMTLKQNTIYYVV